MLAEVRRALWGKSHYFDVDTLRFFGARHGSWRRLGLRYLVCVESVASPSWNIARTYRVIVVDLMRGKLGRFNAGGAGVGVESDWQTGGPARARVRKASEAWCRMVVRAG